MENTKKFTILYVDDEESNLNIFRNTFRREYKVLTAINAQQGLEILKNESVDLILTDQRMPEMDGVTFLKHTLQSFPELNRILITGYTDFDALKSAINEAKIFQYIQKPWKEAQLRNVIDKALEIYQLKQENQFLNQQLIEKNETLERINQDLLEFDKLKMDFLSLISHEIRTPLNGIVASIDLLKQDIPLTNSESLNTLILIIETSVNRLEKFLLSAERITQLKSGKYYLAIQNIDANELITSIIDARKEDLCIKNCTINVNISSNFNLKADKNLIIFCIDELLDNALKHSPTGSKISINGISKNELSIIEICDQGKGFSNRVLQNPFQLFVSDERSDQQKGLSLALVKLILDAHKGKVELSNVEDRGAKVTIML